MKHFALFIFSILFLPLFLIFLILTSLKFQILNYQFVTSSFERNNIYQKVPGFLDAAFEERKGEFGIVELISYRKIKEQITPELSKDIIEKNLKVTLDFLNGVSRDVKFYLPLKKLGIKTNFKDDYIPLSTFSGAMANQLNLIYGIGNQLTIIWLVILTLLLLIIYIELRLSKKFLAVQLTAYSILIGIFCLLARFFLFQMSKDLSNSIEPSQRIISILASSIIPEIVNAWLIVVGVLFGAAILILITYYSKVKVNKET